MTDEELAAKLEEHAKHGSHAYPALLSAASERLYALSAKCALLGASLAQAEREAESKAAASAPHFDDLRVRICEMQDAAYTFGDTCKEAVRAALDGVLDAIDDLPAPQPAASVEPVAWAHFAKNGNIRIWTSAAKEAVRIAKETGIELTPLYAAPQPDRATLRRIVDAAWNAATESEAVPATEWADRIIDSVISDGGTPQPDRVAEREAEVERLRKDAERYRHLRDSLCCEGYPSSEGSSSEDAYLVITGYNHLYPMTSDQKDAAIYAAIAKTTGKEAKS